MICSTHCLYMCYRALTYIVERSICLFILSYGKNIKSSIVVGATHGQPCFFCFVLGSTLRPSGSGQRNKESPPSFMV